MATDYGNFPITKCPTKAASGLTSKNAPSIKRYMREENAQASRERNNMRRVAREQILKATALSSAEAERLTAQRGKGGLSESEFGTFSGNELFALKKKLGRDIKWLWPEYETFSADHTGPFEDALAAMDKIGMKFTVDGQTGVEYRFFELNSKVFKNGSMRVISIVDSITYQKMLLWSN